jgi:predicted transcriptional regulator
MSQEKIQVFTEREEEFVDMLVTSGFSRKIAMVLVYIASTREVTSREIERGADLRQPEVSLALKNLMTRGWIKAREDTSAEKGRPFRIYTLAMPVSKILDAIEKEKKQEIKNQLALLGMLKEYIG